MIVHWPRGIAGRGELRHEPAHVIDLTPTILELAGVTKPTEWDGRPIPASPGRSLVPTLARDGADRHDFLWWLHEGNRAIRVGDWKLVAVKKMPWELYDMKVDRTETTNLAEREPARARELEELWTRYADDFFSLARQDPASPDDNRPTGH
jgi:arylsulfatase